MVSAASPQTEVNFLNPNLMVLHRNPLLTSGQRFQMRIRDVMNSSFAIHIVSPAQFDSATAQTPGSERRAAIAPALGIASPIWDGLFEVQPGARTAIHHHGEQETIACVLSGICDIRWGTQGELVACAPAGDFIRGMVPLTLDNILSKRPARI
jgi:uncharacterized RmlC-like cupin family protein